MTYPPQGGYPDPNQQPQSGWPTSPDGGQQPGMAPHQQPTDVFGDHSGGTPGMTPPGGGYGPPPQVDGFLPPEPPKKKSNAGVLVGLLAFVIVVATGVTLYFMGVFDPASKNDEAKEPTTVTSDEPSGDETKDDSADESQEGKPTATVEDYYTAAKAHDQDGLVATMCASTYAEYEETGMTDEQWQQMWDAVDQTEYEITGETIAEDGTSAEVTVNQTANGSTKEVTAQLVLEEDAWKICTFA